MLYRAMAQDAATTYPKMAPIDQYLMTDQNAEIALARSAAPDSIARAAEVQVLGPHGFETAVKGTNGFVCIVGRGWTSAADPDFWNPKVRVPICVNAAAARSYLLRLTKETEWGLAGRTQAQMTESITAALARKDLPAMEPGAMCYMLSKQGYGGDSSPHWPPHLMFFYSDTDPAIWGANQPGSPVTGAPDAVRDSCATLVRRNGRPVSRTVQWAHKRCHTREDNPMRNVVYAINITLDGCCDHTKQIADEEAHEYFTNLMRDFDLLVFGRKTYQLMVPYWPDVAKDPSSTKADVEFARSFVSSKKVVFSRSLPSAEEENTRIVRTNLRDEILKLKQEPGKNILVGGVDIPSQLIELGLIDEFRFIVQPIIAGEGRRLMEGVSLPERLRLKLVESKILKSGCVALRYLKQ
jgi:dihydrofolate reductase